MTRRAWVAGALCGALALGGVLGACGGDDDSPSRHAAADPGRPLPTMEADGLPVDFPRDQVPLVEGGEVTSVQPTNSKQPGYSVSMLLDQSPSAAVRVAVSRLENAGWSARTPLAGDPPPVQVLTKGRDRVIVTNDRFEDQTLLSYAISLPDRKG